MPKKPEKPKNIQRVEFDDLADETRKASTSGDATGIDNAPIMYQMSRSHPGLIERIFEDGTRDLGIRKDGVFVPLESE